MLVCEVKVQLAMAVLKNTNLLECLLDLLVQHATNFFNYFNLLCMCSNKNIYNFIDYMEIYPVPSPYFLFSSMHLV